MDWQAWITSVVVVACAAYAGWSLAPKALRRRLAAWAGRPLPEAGGACGGCDNCGTAPGAKPSAAGKSGEQVIRIVRQPPRS